MTKILIPILLSIIGLGCSSKKIEEVVKTISVNSTETANPTSRILLKEDHAGHVREIECEFPFGFDLAKIWTVTKVEILEKGQISLCTAIEIDSKAYEERAELVRRAKEKVRQDSKLQSQGAPSP